MLASCREALGATSIDSLPRVIEPLCVCLLCRLLLPVSALPASGDTRNLLEMGPSACFGSCNDVEMLPTSCRAASFSLASLNGLLVKGLLRVLLLPMLPAWEILFVTGESGTLSAYSSAAETLPVVSCTLRLSEVPAIPSLHYLESALCHPNPYLTCSINVLLIIMCIRAAGCAANILAQPIRHAGIESAGFQGR